MQMHPAISGAQHPVLEERWLADPQPPETMKAERWWSPERTETKPCDRLEVSLIACCEIEAVFEGGGRDERVREPEVRLAPDAPGALRYGAVDRELAKRREQL